MNPIPFQLNNQQRQYLGLIPVQPHWELVELFGYYVYFDGDVIRKKIIVKDGSYYECELNETTSNQRSVLEPKTARGKAKKLNYTASLSFSPLGTYFKYDAQYICIASYTTQRSFFDARPSQDQADGLTDIAQGQQSFEGLEQWLKQWIDESSPQDLSDIEDFKNAKRQHQKYKAGDFFAFKIGRRQWGFGRILLDVSKLRKQEQFKQHKHYGLNNLMGKALIVEVYAHIQDHKQSDLDTLAQCQALLAQAVMDNHFFYAEKEIIGFQPLDIEQIELPISYSESINSQDRDVVYLQYGLIYKQLTKAQHDQFIAEWNADKSLPEHRYFRNEGIGFDVNIDPLMDYMAQLAEPCSSTANMQSTVAAAARYYWPDAGDVYSDEHARDLHYPQNSALKKRIFNAFGLDANLSYAENLAIFEDILE